MKNGTNYLSHVAFQYAEKTKMLSLDPNLTSGERQSYAESSMHSQRLANALLDIESNEPSRDASETFLAIQDWPELKKISDERVKRIKLCR
ncbi:hypothetical protein [Vibrio rotiferianus]|uniref:hypothetical protein n=1 Tax=Vibrio rotiferianus TaxID=190895 RepID=UPI0005ED63B1|nr:hypothetical protein [Vibrio rotiferianus]